MATVARRNLVVDPRFATLPEIYTNGTASFSTEHVRPNRTKSVKFQTASNDPGFPVVFGDKNYVLTSEQTLYVGCWVYDTKPGSIGIAVDSPWDAPYFDTVEGWTWISRSIAGPLNSRIILAMHYYMGYPIWINDPIAEIRTTTLPASDYFDGSFPMETRPADQATRSYAWEGAIDNSMSVVYNWEVPTSVTPTNPTVVQTSCSGATQVAPALTRPTNTSSIVYTQSGNVVAGGTTVVTATAQTGYIFPTTVSGWVVDGTKKISTKTILWQDPNCTVGVQIVWNQPADQIYELGIDRGVLYVGSLSAPWNGLTSVTVKQDGGDLKSYYVDGVKRMQKSSNTDFSGDLSAFTYPPLFRACDGQGQIKAGFLVDNYPRKPFGMSYRSLIGNGVKGKQYGYKIHLIYNVVASSGDKGSSTITDSSDPEEYSWTLTSVPDRSIEGHYGSHFVLDSREIPAAKLLQIENILYGTSSVAPRLLPPSEISTIIG